MKLHHQGNPIYPISAASSVRHPGARPRTVSRCLAAGVLLLVTSAVPASARVIAVEIFSQDKKTGKQLDQATLPPQLKDRIPAGDTFVGHDRALEGIRSLQDGDVLIFNCHGSRYTFGDGQDRIPFQNFWKHFNRNGKPPRLKAVLWTGCMWDPGAKNGGVALRPTELDRWRLVLNADVMFSPKHLYVHVTDRDETISIGHLLLEGKIDEAVRSIRGNAKMKFIYVMEGSGGDRNLASIVFLIDASGSMRDDNKIEKAKSTAISQIQRLDAGTEVAVITFHNCSGGITVVSEFAVVDAASKTALASAIGKIQPGGDTNLAEATAFAGDFIRKKGRGAHRTLIVLSDGEETCKGDPTAAARGLNP
ncbi:MAG: VWA domain-containing protein [Lentisphaerae bacterium]|nr:VWA domain-containing protein [Lentisphaerota bacterium]